MTSNQPPEILHTVLTTPLLPPKSASADRPHVTLTYAQSLDAKIAGVGGKQLILSGKESMLMTHWMRTMHDAILVGIGTALNDDPQLNTRHVPNNETLPAPRPVILDANLRLQPNCKLLKNYAARTGRRPWVFYSQPRDGSSLKELIERRTALEAAGAVVIDIPRIGDGTLDLNAMLREIHARGVRSLMVEGGQRVISSFMRSAALVDVVIVTVAPTLVGPDGVGVSTEGTTPLKLDHVSSALLGKDTVVACRVMTIEEKPSV
ncbi:bacterial bifunctional deaminase-reductase [Auriculariales sp. MPI-PUGE-AT-0066]|nr:bacterial bifunctional deaminase-reductase [Auriculariales sp. MPI-PUGE-AT-0066]